MRKLPGHHASSSVVRFKSTQRPLVNTQRASVNAHPKIETCLPPAPLDIDALFRNPRMFDSRQAFHKSGFEVWQNNRHNIMVGSHPSAPDHLFKQYDGHVPLATQLTNYARREKVARSLREVIFEKGFRRLVVPQKWICSLPRPFGDRKLLIVERMKLLDRNEVAQRYHHIDEDQLKELCWALFKFRHLDAAPHNIIFVRSGQIAFIDTEHWNPPGTDLLHRLRDSLPSHARKLAYHFFDQWKRGKDF
jgi:hypothetical protein